MKRTVVMLCVATGLFAQNGLGRQPVPEYKQSSRIRPSATTASQPAYNITEHNVGILSLPVTNIGVLGSYSINAASYDCFTGLLIINCGYPNWTAGRYLYGGGYWIGGIVANDTLVSVGADGWLGQAELLPDIAPQGRIIARSLVDSTLGDPSEAVSEQDFIAVCFDTFVDQDNPHIPLNIKLTQESYAWSYAQTDDFVLFHISIENIGTETINDMYFGTFIDADICDESAPYEYFDDITGYLQSWPFPNIPPSCFFQRDVGIAWAADNNGDLRSGPMAVPHVTGIKFLGSDQEHDQLSYNWYISSGAIGRDYGPMRTENYRPFSTGEIGTPITDADKYYMMSNGERDFDQVFVNTIPFEDSAWIPPLPDMARDLSDGSDTRYLLSQGASQLAPGQSVTVDFAYVAGGNLHRNPDILGFLPDYPDWYYNHLRFDSLALNALFAEWVYDNPGVDTDSDGYAGTFIICEEDTLWTAGDGVPDFRAGTPPPAPVARVRATSEGIQVTWNGHLSETTPDGVLRRNDFEGYRVYCALDTAESPMIEIASYDLDDYHTYKWDTTAGVWVCSGERKMLRNIRCELAPGGCEDSMFAPADYTREHPFYQTAWPYAVTYFEPIGCNRSEPGRTSIITKRFPDALLPLFKSPAEVPPDSRSEYLTEEGQFQYYEYKCDITGLVTGERYKIAVTAFDYGSWSQPALSLESPIPATSTTITIPANAACCFDLVGNVDADPNELVDIGDLAALIDYLFISMSEPACLDEANLDCDPHADVDIVDLTTLIDFLFITGRELCGCAQ